MAFSKKDEVILQLDETMLGRLGEAATRDATPVPERIAQATKDLAEIRAREAAKPATPLPVEKSNIEKAIEEGTLRPVDRTKSKS